MPLNSAKIFCFSLVRTREATAGLLDPAIGQQRAERSLGKWKGDKTGDFVAYDRFPKPSALTNKSLLSSPEQLQRGTGVFETQITSDDKATGYEAVCSLPEWIRFLRDKWSVLTGWPRTCCSHAMARGCCQRL